MIGWLLCCKILIVNPNTTKLNFVTFFVIFASLSFYSFFFNLKIKFVSISTNETPQLFNMSSHNLNYTQFIQTGRRKKCLLFFLYYLEHKLYVKEVQHMLFYLSKLKFLTFSVIISKYYH